jgi:hypothetical protein
MNNNLKLIEVQQILKYNEETNNKQKIKDLFEKYKKELEDFTYVENETYFINNKKIYIRYVGFNNKINYGGFFYKTEKLNKSTYIYLINSRRKVWHIDFNKNYIFANKIISEDDKIRKAFMEFLEKNK